MLPSFQELLITPIKRAFCFVRLDWLFLFSLAHSVEFLDVELHSWSYCCSGLNHSRCWKDLVPWYLHLTFHSSYLTDRYSKLVLSSCLHFQELNVRRQNTEMLSGVEVFAELFASRRLDRLVSGASAFVRIEIVNKTKKFPRCKFDLLIIKWAELFTGYGTALRDSGLELNCKVVSEWLGAEIQRGTTFTTGSQSNQNPLCLTAKFAHSVSTSKIEFGWRIWIMEGQVRSQINTNFQPLVLKGKAAQIG